MQIYRVGGSVRDQLLGLPVQDQDWVVVGATPEQMSALGYVPVGRDFPVFLHPQTHEEYALARTERKTAHGYRGFAVQAAPEVTLEQDLARRDLTINAMALPQTAAPGTLAGLIDPYGGQRDVQRKVFRHVTQAFREDPVRILRVARFAARFTDFTLAPETLALMRAMVQAGEVAHLVAERVWQELARGLMEKQPSRMLLLLRECGALQCLLPEVDRLWGVPQRAEHHPEVDTGVHLMMVLDMSARLNASLAVRLACLTHDLGKGTTPGMASWGSQEETKEVESDPTFPTTSPTSAYGRHLGHEGRSAQLLKGLCERLRVPLACRELADVVAREHGNIHRSASLGAAAVVRLLERCDAFRKPQRWDDILLACECDARGRLGFSEAPYPQRPRLLAALAAAQSVATDAVAAQAQARGITGAKIGQLIAAARVQAVAAAI